MYYPKEGRKEGTNQETKWIIEKLPKTRKFGIYYRPPPPHLLKLDLYAIL